MPFNLIQCRESVGVFNNRDNNSEANYLASNIYIQHSEIIQLILFLSSIPLKFPQYVTGTLTVS